MPDNQACYHDGMSEQAATSAMVLISKSDNRPLPWPDHVVDYAFQAWAFLDNQDCTAVRARLLSGEFCLDEDALPIEYDVPVRTIRDWVHRHEWHDKQARFIQQSVGGIVMRVVGNMAQIALNGSHSIDQQIRAGIPPSRDIVEAVKLATSVIGLSAIGSRDPSKGVLAGGSANRKARLLHLLSDDELLEAEREAAEPDDR